MRLRVTHSITRLARSRQCYSLDTKARATAKSKKKPKAFADTKQPFAYTDACVVHGVHFGHDPVATREAKRAILELVNRMFQLY
jgi:hypothetical protein